MSIFGREAEFQVSILLLSSASSPAPPFLILHGTEDLNVPVNQSEILFAALKKSGVDATFFEVIGAGHGGPQFYKEDSFTTRASWRPVIRAMVLAFFDQHLKPKL